MNYPTSLSRADFSRADAMTTSRLLAFISPLFVAVFLTSSSGCDMNRPPASPNDAEREATGARDTGSSASRAPLEVLVIDDPELSRSIERQWASDGEGGVQFRSAASAELNDDAQRLDADVVVYPDRLIGEMVQRGLIRPLPRTMWESERLNQRDFLPSARLLQARWANENYAVPLGSPQLMLVWRPDVLGDLSTTAPTRWSDYRRLAEQLAESPPSGIDGDPWWGTIEPLGPTWRSQVLLMRVAGYIRQRGEDASLFDVATMRPLIDSPPFIRALDDLKDATRFMPDDVLELTPAEVYRRFRAGRAAMAITWPGRSFVADDPAEATEPVPTALAVVPGSDQVYRSFRGRWMERDAQDEAQVPLMGIDGRVASVTRETGRVAAAGRFLEWLAGPRTSATILADNSAAAPFRHSQLPDAATWLPAGPSDAAVKSYVEAVVAAEESALYMTCLRIPGNDRYMAALDEAVRKTVADECTAQEALEQAAGEWSEITEELGLADQRTALRQQLGRPTE